MANPHDAVSSFDFIKNQSLEDAYTRQREIFRNEGKTIREVFLFHGTAAANVDSILRENLSLELSSEQQGKERKRLFGKGIYFSQYPAVSLMYGNGLILFKSCWATVNYSPQSPCWNKARSLKYSTQGR